MSDLVGNPEDRFSRVAAHIKILLVCMYNCFKTLKEVEESRYMYMKNSIVLTWFS